MRRLLLTAIFFPLLISCQKEDEEPKTEQPKVLTKEEILINHKWTKTDIRVSQGGRVPVIADVSCIQDDYITFSKDGTYKIVNGAICNPENIPFSTGDWKIEGINILLNQLILLKSSNTILLP